MNIKATYKDVGLIGVPNDNSYSQNLSTFQNESIAGYEVKIISRPFRLYVMTDNFKSIEREFVIVQRDKFVIRIINAFKEITNRKT